MTKIALFMALLLAVTLIATVPAKAQVIRVVSPISFINGGNYVRAVNSIADSAVGYSIDYNSLQYPNLVGQRPDSIRFRWYSTADSLQSVLIRVKSAQAYGQNTTGYTSVLLDSVHSGTAAVSGGTHTIPIANIQTYDLLGVSLVANPGGNAVLSKNASRISMIMERFFHK